MIELRSALNAAFDGLETGVAVFDRDKRLVTCTAPYVELLGYPSEFAEPGRSLDDFLRFDAAREPEGAVLLAEATDAASPGDGRSRCTRLPHAGRDGSDLEVRSTPIADGGLVSTCRTVAANGASFLGLGMGEALEAMTDGFAYFDADDGFVLCNGKYREIHAPLNDILVPGTQYVDLIRRSIEIGYLNIEGQSADEYVCWRLMKRRDANGHLDIRLSNDRCVRIRERRTRSGGMVRIDTEITDVKEREKALRTLSAQLGTHNMLFDAALNNMAQGLCMFDAEQRLIVVNRRYLEMYNFSPQIVKPGITLREIMAYSVAIGNYSPDEGERALAERPTQAAKREEDVLLQRLKDGRVIAVMHQPMANGGSVATYEDVTKRETTEWTLREYATKLERSNQELQDFAFVASHDLQEPLRKIEAFGDRLAAKCADDLGPDGKLYLERMQKAAGRMRRLITDLLSYSRITTRAQPFVATSLATTIQEVQSDLQVTIEETGTQIEADPLPIIEADPTQLRQLLQNLLSNAIKFRKKDEAPRIHVSAHIEQVAVSDLADGEPVRELCVISIADNGIGFEEKYADRIFAIFQRLHGKSEYEGTGIGLATCRKIAERHSGVITVRSRPGEGSTFVVSLPTRQPTAENAP